MKSKKLSVAILIGLLFDIMTPSASFKNVFESRTEHRRGNVITVLPIWTELGSVMAQLTLTPALIYYVKNQMQEEVVTLNQKVVKMEQSMQNATTLSQEKKSAISQVFSDDMRSAVTTYQRLYGGTNEKILSAMTNEEKRVSFEQKLLVSLAEVQGLDQDILDLREEGKVLRSKVESSLVTMGGTFETLRKDQLEQESKLAALQDLELKDRALLRRESKKEQRAAASSLSAALVFIRNDVERLKETARETARIAAEAENNRISAEKLSLLEEPSPLSDVAPVPVVTAEELESLLRQVELLERELTATSAAMLQEEQEQFRFELSERKKEQDAMMKAKENVSSYEKAVLAGIEADRIAKEAMMESINKQKEKEMNERNKEINQIQSDLSQLERSTSAIDKLEESSKMMETVEGKNRKDAEMLLDKVNQLEIAGNEQKERIQEEKQGISGLESMMKGLTDRLFKSQDAMAAAAVIQKKNSNELIPSAERRVRESSEMQESTEGRDGKLSSQLKAIENEKEKEVMANMAERRRVEDRIASLSEISEMKIEDITKEIDSMYTQLEAAEKANKNERIVLKSSQLYANADLIDGIEKLQDKQSSMNEFAKISIVRSETDFRKKIQAASDKIEVDAVGVQKAKSRFDSLLADASSQLSRKQNSNNEKLKNTERNINEKIEQLSDSVDAVIAETANRGIAEFNREYRQETAGAMRETKDSVTAKLKALSDERTGSEKALQGRSIEENNRLQALVMSTASSTRSSLDGKLKAVQTESDLEAASLAGILDLVDSTVERRVEKVVERRGFRTVAGKIVRSAATQAVGGVKGVGRGLGSFGAYLIGRGDFGDGEVEKEDEEKEEVK